MGCGKEETEKAERQEKRGEGEVLEEVVGGLDKHMYEGRN